MSKGFFAKTYCIKKNKLNNKELFRMCNSLDFISKDKANIQSIW